MQGGPRFQSVFSYSYKACCAPSFPDDSFYFGWCPVLPSAFHTTEQVRGTSVSCSKLGSRILCAVFSPQLHYVSYTEGLEHEIYSVQMTFTSRNPTSFRGSVQIRLNCIAKPLSILSDAWTSKTIASAVSSRQIGKHISVKVLVTPPTMQGHSDSDLTHLYTSLSGASSIIEHVIVLWKNVKINVGL